MTSPYPIATAVYTIARVTRRPFRKGPRFEIQAYTTAAPPQGPLEVYTWDPLKASLCERARELQRPVTLTTQGSWYGVEVKDVALMAEDVSGEVA